MSRYSNMKYNRCGTSSLRLPQLSLGMWHNFGDKDNLDMAKEMILHSFDRGITHFDLANNYGGAVPGSAESNFGRIFKENMAAYRDEVIISSKAGHEMWAGPYGGNSSRKNIIASINQSLKRTQLEYFDIFYTHRYDKETPVEETAQALIDIVRQGKALYVGISKYPVEQATKIYELLREAKTPAIVAQYRYSMLVRDIEPEIMPLAKKNGAGIVAFSSLAQGMLAGRYMNGIPSDSRMGRAVESSLAASNLKPEVVEMITRLNELAQQRGESLAQMALAWSLRDEAVTSLVIGASSTKQIDQNLEALQSQPFTAEELATIDAITLPR